MTTSPITEPKVEAERQDEVQRRESEALIGLLHSWREDDRGDQREIVELLEAELPRNPVRLPEHQHGA